MRHIKLTVEYDGTDFCGWQWQPETRTVQGVLEEALAGLLKQHHRVQAAGRTDAGVHAAAQVVSFATESQVPLKAFREGLNSRLPHDLAVTLAEEAVEGFDARFHARGKRYLYRVLQRRAPSPLQRRFVWQQKRTWDIEALRTAIPSLLGEHDFTSFRASDCAAKTTVRRIHSIELSQEGDELRLLFYGTAFLKHMVRNMVGTLAEVATGKRAPHEIAEILAARDRRAAGVTAPPQGLCLLEVLYAAPSDVWEFNTSDGGRTAPPLGIVI